MVCCGRDFLVVWTIVLGLRRRESELLYDRARSRRLRALYCGAPFVSSGIVARVGRARVFRRPRGLTRCEPRETARESLATPPCGRLHTLVLPPSWPHGVVSVAPSSALVRDSAHDLDAAHQQRSRTVSSNS